MITCNFCQKLKNIEQMKKITFIILLTAISYSSLYAQDTAVSISIMQKEKWWSGIINEAQLMPYSSGTNYTFKMLGDNDGNQVQPLLLSSKGRYVWSEEPFQIQFKNRVLQISGLAQIDTGTAGSTLKEAQLLVRNKYFPASGKFPDTLLVTKPQYNTWIELNYNQNENDVLKYAHAIIENGLPVGVLMIDDTWEEDYGVWDFHPKRFPNPKKMMDELHQLGFKVMVWVCPFVSADSKEYRELVEKRALINDSNKLHTTSMINWWNGFSAELDFSNPATVNWFQEKLNYLQNTYGVDGFKFDAGDFIYYPLNSISKEKITSNQHSSLYGKIGLQYPLNEYRACWKMGGQPLVQRLRDKEHNWADMQKLIPGMVLTGLVGYTFSCPDMIGGGELNSFSGAQKNIDQELIVRSAQCHALMPMMQFSVAPWRVLDSIHFAAVKKAVELRMKFTPLIVKLMKQSAQNGEPIIKSMEYVFPNQGFAETNDQYMLGDSIMVAPIVNKGTIRVVKFPKFSKGKWKATDGKIYKGGTVVSIDAPLDMLPYFEIVK